MSESNRTNIDSHQETIETTRVTALDAQRWKLYGYIGGLVDREFTHRQQEVEEDYDRFETAIDEQWALIYGEPDDAESQWMITEMQGGDELILHYEADPQRVGTLIFDNGWIYAGEGSWLQDRRFVEEIRQYHYDAVEFGAEASQIEQTAIEEDDRIEQATRDDGTPIQNRYVFTPSKYVGSASQVLAHASGWDAVQTPDQARETYPRGEIVEELQ